MAELPRLTRRGWNVLVYLSVWLLVVAADIWELLRGSFVVGLALMGLVAVALALAIRKLRALYPSDKILPPLDPGPTSKEAKDG